MSPFVLSIFNSIVFALYCYLVSCIILEKKETNIKKICMAFIPFFIAYYTILCLLDSIYAIFFSSLCAFLFIKIIFRENIYMSLIISIVIHTIKNLFKILILFFLNNDALLLINTYKTLDLTAFYVNIVAMLEATMLIFLLRKPSRKLIKYISSLKNRQIILLISIYLNFILILLFQPPVNTLSLDTISSFFVIFVVTGIGVFGVSSEMKMESLTRHYQEIFEYSKANEELLNNYKMQIHENKNKLLMIKGMLDDSVKNTSKYIDTILKEINDNKNNNNYWLTELKYIPLSGIRNFINYKLIKLKDIGAEIEVFVSSELENINPTFLNEQEYNQLSTILGVILDNMIDSINETKEKLISINIYLEDNKIQGEFVNSFSGEIDLSRLNEIGYTTKGERRGVGLPLVANIIKINDRFECYPKIMDNFFIQHLNIMVCSKNNLQKISKKQHYITKDE